MIFSPGDALNPTAAAQEKLGNLGSMGIVYGRGQISGRALGIEDKTFAVGTYPDRIPPMSWLAQWHGYTGVGNQRPARIYDAQLDNVFIAPVASGATISFGGTATPTQAQVESLFSSKNNNFRGLSLAAGQTLTVTLLRGASGTSVGERGTTSSVAAYFAVVNTAYPFTAGATVSFQTSLDSGVTWSAATTVNQVASAEMLLASLGAITGRDVRWTITAPAGLAVAVIALGAVTVGSKAQALVHAEGGTIHGEIKHSAQASTEKKKSFQTLGITRWRYGQSTTDNYEIDRHNASGVKLDTPLSISTSTGAVTLSSALAAGGPISPAAYTVATLPSAAVAGQHAYASNGRVGVEMAAAGTGCPVYSKGGQWCCCRSNVDQLCRLNIDQGWKPRA